MCPRPRTPAPVERPSTNRAMHHQFSDHDGNGHRTSTDIESGTDQSDTTSQTATDTSSGRRPRGEPITGVQPDGDRPGSVSTPARRQSKRSIVVLGHRHQRGDRQRSNATQSPARRPTETDTSTNTDRATDTNQSDVVNTATDTSSGTGVRVVDLITAFSPDGDRFGQRAGHGVGH